LDYFISINYNIFNVVSFTPSQTLSTGFIEFIVSGTPFGTTATTSNEEFQIRPNDFVVDRIFAEDFDEVQKFLLNRLIRPEYTAVFQVPQQNEAGQFYTNYQQVTWPKEGPWNLDIKSFLFEDYLGQLEAIEASVTKRIGLVKAPPGAGKTCIMTGITVAVGGRTLLLTEREEPMLQAEDAYGKYTTIKPTLYCGKKKKLSEVTVGTVQTFKNAIIKGDAKVLEWLKGVDLVLIDESHHVATEQYATVLDSLHDPKFIIGVSATPEDREDSTAMYVTAYLGNVIYEITYAELIDAGSLLPVTVFIERMPKNETDDEEDITPKFNQQTNEPKSYQEVREQSMYFNDYANNAAAEFVKQCVASGKSCAVIVGNIQQHAAEIEKLLPDAVPLYGGNNNRKEIIDKLRRKEIMVVITTLFDEAVDVPSLDAVAVLAGGKSKIKLKQRVRSTRAFEGETAIGTYKKTRGYVWMPFYQDKYLVEHSRKRLRELKEVVAEHPLNKLEVIEL
jgi:superfamily II DNA or RNA helicase